MQVLTSQLKNAGMSVEQFKQAVNDYAAALTKHTDSVGSAAPGAPNSFVEDAVVRKQYPLDAGKPDAFVPEYEIVDDTPPPPTLKQRKDVVEQRVRTRAQEAIDAIAPPRKEHLFQMLLQEASALPEDQRNDQQKAVLAQFSERQPKINFILRDLAQQLHDLDDAGDDTIEKWESEYAETK